MSEFDGRKVVVGIMAVFMSAGLIAVAGPFGMPFFLFALLYLLIATSAPNAMPLEGVLEPLNIRAVENPTLEWVIYSREIVLQNAAGEKWGVRQRHAYGRPVTKDGC